jgi:hypothetical protein
LTPIVALRDSALRSRRKAIPVDVESHAAGIAFPIASHSQPDLLGLLERPAVEQFLTEPLVHPAEDVIGFLHPQLLEPAVGGTRRSPLVVPSVHDPTEFEGKEVGNSLERLLHPELRIGANHDDLHLGVPAPTGRRLVRQPGNHHRLVPEVRVAPVGALDLIAVGVPLRNGDEVAIYDS